MHVEMSGWPKHVQDVSLKPYLQRKFELTIKNVYVLWGLRVVIRIVRGGWSQVAERLGDLASNQKVAGSIPGCAKICCVLGKGTSPYFPRGNVSVLTVSRSG